MSTTHPTTPTPAAAEAGAALSAERRTAINGYAPGSYFCKCVNCAGEFLGDKRAHACPRCAYEQPMAALEARLQATEAALAQEKQRAADAEARWLRLADAIRQARHTSGDPYSLRDIHAHRANLTGGGTAGAWDNGVREGRATMAADLLNAVGL